MIKRDFAKVCLQTTSKAYSSSKALNQGPGNPVLKSKAKWRLFGLYLDNAKEYGTYYSIVGLYWGNEKDNGNYSKLGLIFEQFCEI